MQHTLRQLDFDFIKLLEPTEQPLLSLVGEQVSAGFPSPAEDFVEESLDIVNYLVENPAATFLVRVKGDSMINANIHHGDLLVVDRALDAMNQSIVIAIIDNDFTLKRYSHNRDTRQIKLIAENDDYPDIKVRGANEFQLWGVVRHSIQTFV